MRLRGQHQSTVDSRTEPAGNGAPPAPPSRLSLLTEAARAITADLPQDELLQRVSDIARQMIGAHQSIISLTMADDAAQSISAISLSDKYAAWREYAEKPDGSGIYCLVVRDGRPMRLTQAELEAHPAYRGFGNAAGAHPPTRGWLAAPLLGVEGSPIGLIQLSDKYEGEFTAEDEQLVVHLAVLAVLAIERARVRTEAAENGVLLEAVQGAGPVGFAVFDEDLRYVRVNEALAEMNGVPAEDHVGRTIGEIVPGLSSDVEPSLRRVLAAGSPAPQPIEVSGTTAATGAETRHWLVSYYPVEMGGAGGLGCVVFDVTERRRSGAALRASEERFRSLFENAAAGMALMDESGAFVQANPAFCRLLGRSGEELSNLRWEDVIHPKDRLPDSAGRERLLAGTTDLSATEARFLHADGHTVWARLLGASVRRAPGEPPFTLVQTIDVTEQRRLEEATGRLYALTRDLFSTVGFDGRIKSVNPAWERALGYAPGELIGRVFLDFVAEEDRVRSRRELERLRASGDLTVDFETRHVHKDGTLRWLLWSAYVSGDEELVYGVAKDVTDRKRSEERLRESERKYRDLVETSSDLIWSVDNGGRFTFVNRAARRIYGYEPEEMLGRPVADFETHEQRLEDENALRGVLAGVPLFSYETRHVRKDGRAVDLSVNAIVRHDDSGAVLGATGTATDVTDRRRYETRQAVVAELGRRALEGVGLAEITEAAVSLVAEALGLHYSAVLELVPGEDRLIVHAGIGWPARREGTPMAARRDSSHAAYAIQVDGPVVVEDFREERRFERSALLDELGARSGVCVTIEGETRPFGALCGYTTRRRAFTADEVHFLQAVANVLATAIGRKRTEEQIVELAAARGRLVAQTLAAEDRARRSISEVLHDHALQDLLASRQDLVEVIEEPDGDPQRAVRAREGIERAVQLLREAVFNLHPVVLEHAGLASAIRAVADPQGRRGNFECEIEVDADATGVHDELILSLARELLTNAAKHAEADNVTVEVRRKGSWIVLTVEDDGRGIELGRREAALRDGHVGLASSAERVEALVGRFEVEGRPGGGTRAQAVLPARRAAGHRADRSSRLPRLSGGRRGSGRSDPRK